ncbi:MAG: cysteine desulfurase family protein [Patescibacteria group bacterium]
MSKIYLDTAAATPVDPRVLAAMKPFWSGQFGNPSSIHSWGVEAAAAVATARRQAADFLAAHPDEIIFTSGATEANNLVLAGVMKSAATDSELIVSAIEHPSVLEPARALIGSKLIILPVNSVGLVDGKNLAAALTSATRLVSVILANHEIGVVQRWAEIAKVIRRWRRDQHSPWPLLHTDASQAARTIELRVEKLGVDLLTLGGGKIYGPKGIGLLYCRRGVQLAPAAAGGGQEAGRRAGTENVPAIVGLGRALELAASAAAGETKKLTKLRDYFIAGLLRLVPDTHLNGSPAERLPHNVNVSFVGTEAEQVVIELDARGIAASAGSACTDPRQDGSYVIMALGRSVEVARAAVRFSLDRGTTRADLDCVLKVLPSIIKKIRDHNFDYARSAFTKI